jgi:hypothetical protein
MSHLFDIRIPLERSQLLKALRLMKDLTPDKKMKIKNAAVYRVLFSDFFLIKTVE